MCGGFSTLMWVRTTVHEAFSSPGPSLKLQAVDGKFLAMRDWEGWEMLGVHLHLERRRGGCL